MVNIPRSRHEETTSIATKQKELKDHENFGMLDMVDKDDATDNIIATEWVPIKKEEHDGTKETKASLCPRGDMEKAFNKICEESPTVNRMSLKILLSIAVSQGWATKTCDGERAFLQLDQTQRGAFVKPPAELDLPKEKVHKLNSLKTPDLNQLASTATKSDMTQVTKLTKKAKEESTDIIITNLGEQEKTVLEVR